MKYGELNLVQIEAVVNKLGGMDGLKRFLSGELIISELPALLFHEELTVNPLTKRFVPTEFFRNREGLYLWNGMQHVLKNARNVEPSETTVTKLRSFDLTKKAYDKEIKAGLPAVHKTELWHIAQLIEEQKNGEAGPLLTNACGNIFYVAGFAVCVHWRDFSHRWRVDDWLLGDGRWSEGPRVFSCN